MNNSRDSFEKYIIKDPSGCWIWHGTCHIRTGHGKFRGHLASRYAMYLYKDFPLDSYSQINHKCNNRTCCNPEHLYIGTRQDNARDSVVAKTHRNSRKTHCPKGHEYSEENTDYYKNSTGGLNRKCKICTTARQRKLKEQRRSLKESKNEQE